MAISRAGKLAAVGAVVIGYHQEGGIQVDGFALKGQVLMRSACGLMTWHSPSYFAGWVTSI